MSAVWAISMMRDEIDIAPTTVAHLLAEGVEHIVVADHGSVDGTAEALAAMEGVEVVPVVDDGPYPQKWVMNDLAAAAADAGATWIVPFDADELWYAPSGQRLADELDGIWAHRVAEAVVWEHYPQPGEDPADPVRNFVHRCNRPWGWPKVAFRPRPGMAGMTLQKGSHGVVPPQSLTTGRVAVRHFPYRTKAQALAKYHWKMIDGAVLFPEGFDPEGTILTDEALAQSWWECICDPTNLVWDPAPVRV